MQYTYIHISVCTILILTLFIIRIHLKMLLPTPDKIHRNKQFLLKSLLGVSSNLCFFFPKLTQCPSRTKRRAFFRPLWISRERGETVYLSVYGRPWKAFRKLQMRVETGQCHFTRIRWKGIWPCLWFRSRRGGSGPLWLSDLCCGESALPRRTQIL